MSRSPSNKPAGKGIHPIWQGIGFVLFVVMTVGGYWLMGYLLDLNARTHFIPIPLPTDFAITIYKDIKLPGRWVIQAGGMLLMDIVGFSLFTIIYGIIRPERTDERDADGMYRRRRD